MNEIKNEIRFLMISRTDKKIIQGSNKAVFENSLKLIFTLIRNGFFLGQFWYDQGLF